MHRWCYRGVAASFNAPGGSWHHFARRSSPVIARSAKEVIGGGRVGSEREREEEDDAKRGGLAWLRWREGVVRGLGDPSHYAE